MTMRKSMTRWKSGSFYIYSTTVYPDNGDYPWLLWRKYPRRRRRAEGKSAALHAALRERFAARAAASRGKSDAQVAASGGKSDV